MAYASSMSSTTVDVIGSQPTRSRRAVSSLLAQPAISARVRDICANIGPVASADKVDDNIRVLTTIASVSSGQIQSER